MISKNYISPEKTDLNAWIPDLGNGTFKNPIIYADYSDPDIIRVGKDFFMVASSFNCIPGIPVLHSYDLVNWSIVSYVIESMPSPEYDLPAHGKGAWAPSLKYHNGFFYIYFAMPDEGVFMSKTKDPFGKWAPLVCVKKVIGWIDPCPFWDEDGNAYLVNAFANSRVGFKSILRLSRMKEDGSEILNEGRFIFDGQTNHVTMEGPKMYKRNGYYYIFTPAGGVKHGWQTVLRSKDIFGPYEDKIVLHQGNTEVNGPHQGGWVELESGESWFLHFQDAKAYGRIVHLQPLTWSFDWPLIGEDINGDAIGEPVMEYKKPDVGAIYPICTPATSDPFHSDKLGLQWQWQANNKEEWYSLTERKNYLRLYAMPKPECEKFNLLDVPNVLTQKFPAPCFCAETLVEIQGNEIGECAGLIVLGDDYYSIAIKKAENDNKIILYTGAIRCNAYGKTDYSKKWDKEQVITSVNTDKVYLKVSVEENALCSLMYSIDGEEYKVISEKFNARPGLWIGAKLGIFCIKDNHALTKESYADFEYFRL